MSYAVEAEAVVVDVAAEPVLVELAAAPLEPVVAASTTVVLVEVVQPEVPT